MRAFPFLLVFLAAVATLSSAVTPALVQAAQPAPFEGRWIDVDTRADTATAYEGSTPVYTAPITAGKPGFETPTGTFYVRSRVPSETMDSETLGVPRDSAEGYYLKNVRYVQYINGDGTALHGNYWMPDSVFGRANTSHGCVGMRNSDAAFFWDFATLGTPVVVRRSDNPLVDSTVGSLLAQAKARLQAAGFQVGVTEEVSDRVAPGTVIAQKPAGGEPAIRGSVVALTVAKAPPAPRPAAVRPPEGDWAWVPEVVGLPEAEARQRIELAGLTNTYTNYQAESDVPESARPFFRSIQPGQVLSVTPAAGERVQKGSVVRLAARKPGG